MKHRYLPLGAFAALAAIDFYLLPLLIADTGWAILMMLGVVPGVLMIGALLYGVYCGWQWLLPPITAILFVPTLWIYYNSTAWVYIIAYAVLAAAANGVGALFYKKR